jgi:hypothetical protein
MIMILVVGIGIARTNAAVELTLSGTPGSSRIDFFLSGTGTIQSGLQFVSLVDLKLSGISFDVFDSSFSPITSFPVTGNATLVNTSTLEAATLDRVFLIDGGPVAGVDEVAFDLSTRVNFVPGQFYSLSGSGTFDVASAGSFGAFNLGSGTATPFGLDFATVSVIPEPPSASQITIGLMLVLLLRHRILLGAPLICPRQQQPNQHLTSRCTE